MLEICDIHCHILPGVDDGAATMEEAINTLKEAASQKIRKMIVTPHFHPGRYKVRTEQTLQVLKQLRERCAEQGIPISLYPGQECYYYSGLVEKLNKKKALTLAGSRYVLVEFEPNCIYTHMAAGLRELRMNGYKPIVAHFERYSCLRDEVRLAELKNQGVMLQMNFDRLLQKDRLFRKNPWRQLVKQGMVDYLGSDCHGMRFRPLHVREAAKWLIDQVDQDILRVMFCENIEKILKNE